MEIYSPRREKIQEKQSRSLGQEGAWLKVIQRTSGDGFTHGPPRKESPLKIAKYTKGSWEDFILHSDFLMDGKGIKIPPHAEDHFVVGMGTVAQIGEEHMFNLRGLQRINLVQKQSHVFDAQTKKFSTYSLPQSQQELWNARFKSDYSKYHTVNYHCPSASLSSQELANTVYLSAQKSKQNLSRITSSSNSCAKQNANSANFQMAQSSPRGADSDHVIEKQQLPASIRALLVVPKKEKSYASISESKKQSHLKQHLPKDRKQNGQQTEEAQALQQQYLLKIGEEQFQVKLKNNNDVQLQQEKPFQLKQPYQAGDTQSKEAGANIIARVENAANQEPQPQSDAQQLSGSVQQQGDVFEKPLKFDGYKTPLQRHHSVNVLRGSSWSDCGSSSVQVARCLSPGNSRSNFINDSRQSNNDLGDFERSKKKRKGLPISDIQLQFREYKKSFDSIRFG